MIFVLTIMFTEQLQRNSLAPEYKCLQCFDPLKNKQTHNYSMLVFKSANADIQATGILVP